MSRPWGGKTKEQLYASILEKIHKVKDAKRRGKLDDILKLKESMSTKDKAQHERVMHRKSVKPNARGRTIPQQDYGVEEELLK